MSGVRRRHFSRRTGLLRALEMRMRVQTLAVALAAALPVASIDQTAHGQSSGRALVARAPARHHGFQYDQTSLPPTTRLALANATVALANKSAVVVVFGLHRRSFGCAWPEQRRRLVKPLEALGVKVTVWELAMLPAAGEKVDGVPYERTEGCAFDLCEIVSQDAANAAADAFVARNCGKAGCRVRGHAYGYTASKPRAYNTARQFHSELAVAARIRDAPFDVAIAISEDLVPLGSLTMGDVAAASTPGVVVTSRGWDWGGVTNGFYAATPKTLATVMSAAPRLEELIELETRSGKPLMLQGNYEGVLARHLIQSNLTRAVFERDARFPKIRHSGAVARPGGRAFHFGGDCAAVSSEMRRCVERKGHFRC